MSVTVVSPDRLQQIFDSLAKDLEGLTEMETLKNAVGALVVRAVQDNFMKSQSPQGSPWVPLAHPRPGGKGADKPLRDTGLLFASWTWEPTEKGVEVFTNRVGADIHNFGGIIRARKAKKLAIPVTRRAKRAGSPRKFGSNLTFQKRGKKTLGLFDDKDELQYLLVDEVRIPQREFAGIGEEAMRRIEDLVSAQIDRIIEKYGG